MANTVAIQEIHNGDRNYVLKVDIVGDGASEIDELLVDVGDIGSDTVRLDKVKGSAKGFDLILEWDGPTKAPLLFVDADNYIDFDYRSTGGHPNPKVASYTGHVRMTTSGLGAGERGSFQFDFVKK